MCLKVIQSQGCLGFKGIVYALKNLTQLNNKSKAAESRLWINEFLLRADAPFCAEGCRCHVPYLQGTHGLGAAERDAHQRGTKQRTKQHVIKCYTFSEAGEDWAPQKRLSERELCATLEGRDRDRWRERFRMNLLEVEQTWSVHGCVEALLMRAGHLCCVNNFKSTTFRLCQTEVRTCWSNE